MLVGAAVNIRYTFNAGAKAVAVMIIALLFRSVGVFICLAGTKLNFRKKTFCTIAYLPKATVKVAIGVIPLSLGLPCGELVLSTGCFQF